MHCLCGLLHRISFLEIDHGPSFYGTVLLARPAEIWVLYLPCVESAATSSEQ
jgi:hypothetical protein